MPILVELMQRQDVRVLQISGGLDLGEETLSTYDSGQLRLQHLERDLSLVLQVVGEVHRGHPALTDLTLDAVAALEGSVQAGDGVWSVQAPKMRRRPADCEQAPLGMDPSNLEKP